jgi:dienelactone hydrolase
MVKSGDAADDGHFHVRRWSEQRWLLDNIIQANGLDWDQPRSYYMAAPCGVEAATDFAGIRTGVKKYADIGPAFEKVARRRQAKAERAEAEGALVTARDNYFMASVTWGGSQWPLHDDGPLNQKLNSNKRECYRKYAQLADHHIEEVWIPFKGNKLPAWFHLPPGYSGGRIPVVISFPGMDSFKEMFVALNGDRWLSRGIAVLVIDGPGQAEARILGNKVTMDNWRAVGPVLVDWLMARPEIDDKRIGIFGNSFGSFFATIVTANEPRISACAVSATCLEPGFHTIFEEASPTYKKRFMYMSGYTEEAKFDEFRKTLTWEGSAEKIKVPYLCVAGEAEELSPLEYADKMMGVLQSPRQYVIYAESRHAVGYVPSANLGPYPPVLIADWMQARLAGKPFKSERWYVKPNGEIDKTAL